MRSKRDERALKGKKGLMEPRGGRNKGIVGFKGVERVRGTKGV